MFGANKTPFEESSFGTASGGEASCTTSGLFGTTVKFNPVISTDTMVKGGVTANINTRHLVITAMKEYENKCFEELRMEDYAANRKFGFSLLCHGMTQMDIKSLKPLKAATSATSRLFGATAQSGTTVKFNQVISADTMVQRGVTTNISTRHLVITAMKEYENKCFEELRMEDYAANRKFGFSFLCHGLTQLNIKSGGLSNQRVDSSGMGVTFGQNEPTIGRVTLSGGAAASTTSGLFGATAQSGTTVKFNDLDKRKILKPTRKAAQKAVSSPLQYKGSDNREDILKPTTKAAQKLLSSPLQYKDSDKREDILKPASEAAQKVLSSLHNPKVIVKEVERVAWTLKCSNCNSRIADTSCTGASSGSSSGSSSSSSSRPSSSKEIQELRQKMKELRQKTEKLEDAQLCNICMVKKKDTAFLCGHITCKKCSKHLKQCPICRKAITNKIPLYLG